MTYDEKLAEFVRFTGHRPGEMNGASPTDRRAEPAKRDSTAVGSASVDTGNVDTGHEGGKGQST